MPSPLAPSGGAGGCGGGCGGASGFCGRCMPEKGCEARAWEEGSPSDLDSDLGFEAHSEVEGMCGDCWRC